MEPQEIKALRQRLDAATRTALDAIVVEAMTGGVGSAAPRPPSQWPAALRRLLPFLTQTQTDAILAYATVAIDALKKPAAPSKTGPAPKKKRGARSEVTATVPYPAPAAYPPLASSPEYLEQMLAYQRQMNDIASFYVLLSNVLKSQRETTNTIVQNLR